MANCLRDHSSLRKVSMKRKEKKKIKRSAERSTFLWVPPGVAILPLKKGGKGK